MSLDMITPPSSPRRESGFVMGSPVKRVISFSLDVPRSPPKMRRVEDKKPEWMEKLKNRVSPNSPTIPLTPLNKIKNGDQCKVQFFQSPLGEIVERSFFVGKSSKANPKGISPNGLHLVHPTDFSRQMDSLEMNLPHCLSPIAVSGDVEDNFLKVNQLFPAGKSLDDYVKEFPENTDNICQLWKNAVFETNQISKKLVADPKPSNAVVIVENEQLTVKLIDLELVDEDDVDDFGDIISGRYFIGEDEFDPYQTAILLGELDMKTGFTLTKEELKNKFLAQC